MAKTIPLNLRVTPEFKALLAKLADGEDRTLTGYIEWLVKQDAKRKARTETKNQQG